MPPRLPTDDRAMPEASSGTAGAKPSAWQRFRSYIVLPMLHPRQAAWSFAIGLSIAFSPLVGIHTLVALAICLFAKGLHRPLMITATFLNNPWTLVPIAAGSVYFGNWLLGRGLAMNLSGISWKSIGYSSFVSQEGLRSMYLTLKPILAPYMLGGFAMSLLALPAGYAFMLWLSKKLRRPRAAKK
jgi:uncharacterized protein (DUF2062 family)